MRDILFKAKLKDWKTNPGRNKWVEGYYLSREETTYCVAEDYERFPVKTLHYIAEECMTDWGLPNEFRLYEIDPDTICQLIQTDKVRVWENDIVRWEDEDDIISVIRYYFEEARFVLEDYGVSGCLMEYGFDETAGEFKKLDINGFGDFYEFNFEVIGNVFDNPELINPEFKV